MVTATALRGQEVPAPLPRWADTVFRLIVVIVVLGIVGIPTLLMAWVRTPIQRNQYEQIQQPVEFDHRHHVRDDGIGCTYCHHEVGNSPYAGVPPTELCMGCHNQIWNESPLLEPVRRSWWEDEPIVWTRVHNLPDFVYFNHSAHVTAGVGCESCHGRVDRMSRVHQVEPLTMEWCLDCHRDPEPYLRPQHAITEMGYDAPDSVGRRILEERNVDPGTYCSTCHR